MTSQEFRRQYLGTFATGTLCHYDGDLLVCEVKDNMGNFCRGIVRYIGEDQRHDKQYYLCEKCARNAIDGAYGPRFGVFPMART